MVQVGSSFSVLGLLVLAAIVLLVVVAAVVLIVLLATRKKDDGATTPVGDSGIMGDQESYFDGGFFGYIGHQILFGLISFFSFGIAVPWALCMMKRWEVNHTVVNGRRLKFTGTGGQLFGKYILGVFLSIITFGIYSIWFGLSIEKWAVSHTVYADDPDEKASRFTGGAGGWFAYNLLMIVLPLVTFGIGLPFAIVMRAKWLTGNTVIGGSPLVFTGSGGRLFGKMLLWGLLSVVTFGIFDLFVYVKYLRWEKGNTGALYRSSTYKDFAREQEKYVLENVSAYGLAANNTEIAKLRSGVNGNESPESIKAMAEGGNIYACYDYACALIDKYGENNDKAIEMLRTAAYGGYHQAMLRYAYYVRSYSEQEFVDLVKGAAKAGSFEAPRVLKEYYEGFAYDLKDSNDPGAVDALREGAYWFKVAISQGSYGNEDVTYEYEKMLDTIAFWKASGVGPQKGGAGVIVGAVLGAMALLAILGVGAVAVLGLLGMSVPSFGMGKVEDGVSVITPAPYDEFESEDDYYGEIAGSDMGYLSNVVGYTEADAVIHIESMACVCQVTYIETTDYIEGTVISCSHPEGEYPQGEIITIEVAVAPQYPELTRSRAFELIDRAYVAREFMCYYFDRRGMMDRGNIYDLEYYDSALACGSVSGVYTQADMKNALSADFTDEYIDDMFMITTTFFDVSSVTIYEGLWFEANGQIYCVPNDFVGLYSVYEETLSVEEIGAGRYRVTAKGGAPTLDDCSEYECTVVYDEADGEYKIDY